MIEVLKLNNFKLRSTYLLIAKLKIEKINNILIELDEIF